VVARLLAPKLSEIFGEQFYVENHPGASGNIGTALVAKAPGDGYTILVVTSATVASASAGLEPGVQIDPGSPAAKQYVLQLNQGRQTGAQGSHSSSTTAPFGAGITPRRLSAHTSSIPRAVQRLDSTEGLKPTTRGFISDARANTAIAAWNAVPRMSRSSH